MAVVTGTLWDIGTGHLGGRQPQLVFEIDRPGTKGGYVYATEPEIVTPAADGSWSANLTPTVDMLDQCHYKLSMRWLDPAGNFVRVDFPDWEIHVSSAGGKFTDLITKTSNSRMVHVSTTAPKDPQMFSLWLQMDPENPASLLNTGNLYERRKVDMDFEWKYLANLKGAPAQVDAPGVLSYTLPWIPSTTTGNLVAVRGTPTFAAGKFGSALSGGVLNCDNLFPEPVGYTQTIECWVNSSTIPGTKESIIWGTQNSMWLSAAEGTGFARFTLAFATSSRATSTVNICDGAWHHVAVSLTRESGTTILKGFWVDGIPTGVTAPTNARAWPIDLIVGGHWSDASYDWVGRIDDLRVSAGQVYSSTFTPPTSANRLNGRTLIHAPLDSLEATAGNEGYPARPVGAPDGAVTYVGPVVPTTWHTDDKWEKIA